jgi:nucleotide-binding universal stress UspA family protein
MTIVVGLDRDGDAKSTLETAARLAEKFDTGIEVVHVLERDEFMDLERTSVEETAKPVGMDEVRAVAAEIATELVGDTLDEFEVTGLVGDPASELVRLAGERDAEYIVIGVRKRSAVGKALFGSVAQDVLMDTDRPVVVVPKPDA